MSRKRKSLILNAALLLVISILLGGCLNLADDITPPQEIQSTKVIDQQPISTPTVVQSNTVIDDSGPLDDSYGEIIVDVIDHTGGFLLGQDLMIHLEGYDDFNKVVEESSPLTDASYVIFTDVPVVEERVFFASISYGGAVYRSNVIQITQDSSDLVLQVQIFDTTTDDSGLIIDRIHVLIDFPSPDFVQVSEIYIISNFSDATVVAKESGQAVISFPLPEGANNLEFENGTLGQRFIKTEDGFGDTVSIPPGSGVYQVLVYYNLPYQKAKLNFSQVMNYPVSAVVAMTPANRVKVKGGFLEDLGVQAIPSGEVQVYSGGVIDKGDKLEFRLTGSPDTLTDNQVLGIDGVNAYVIGIGILGIGLILAGILIYIRNRNNDGDQIESVNIDEKNQILDSLIALEDLYNDGEVSEKDYQKKRDELKQKLNNLVQKE